MKITSLGLSLFSVSSVVSYGVVATAQQSLSVVYPPPKHQTTSEKIFLIGTSTPQGEVTVNGTEIQRSPQGHFAPSFPLEVGENTFVLRQNGTELAVTVTRVATEPDIPTELAFVPESLFPKSDLTRLVGETVCFSAIAPPDTEVTANLVGKRITLLPQIESVDLPANVGVLVGENAPVATSATGRYWGCEQFQSPGNYGTPQYTASIGVKRVTATATGNITIARPQDLEVVEVTAENGVARTGASTNYSRLTPLPQGTRASVTAKEGEWLRLDYGGWIKAEETTSLPSNTPTHSLIRSITSRQQERATEVVFPLQVAVPLSVRQQGDSITLTLHNTTAQTDTIRLDNDPLIERLDWQQITPDTVEYTFRLKASQQWGYDVRYEGTSLIFTLRHPPQLNSSVLPLKDIKILLDPGHGGEEAGAKSPTGEPEKTVNLEISQLLKAELTRLGATVYLTREEDTTLGLKERVAIIEEIQPDIALSIHYNALPDNGDAEKTQGISMFWYHPQAHSLAVALHDDLVTALDRPSAGVFWNNLALTRPHTAPTVLLELGFLINPWEYEWISDRKEREKLVKAIASSVANWVQTSN